MSDPFLGEVKIVSFSFAPKGWAACNGQLLPINQNQPLFSLLGTRFGGDGHVNFALPNFQGRTPIHVGNGFNLGDSGGEATHTLTPRELPMHTHFLSAGNAAPNTPLPANAFLAAGTAPVYSSSPPSVTLAPSAVTSAGGGQPHPNMQPYLTLSFVIALQGIFPSQN